MSVYLLYNIPKFSKMQHLFANFSNAFSLPYSEIVEMNDAKKIAITIPIVSYQSKSLNKNITSKGIPVITIEDGGEIKQHAEIEKEEIILSLSLTKQIEKLWKEGTEEAAIEAGKLFTKALMEDTEDNVGLIEKVQNENKS